MRITLIILTISLLSIPAYGAIVNTLPEMLEEDDKDLHMDLAVSLSWEEGNNDVLDVGIGGALLWRHEDLLLYAIASYVRNGDNSNNLSNHATLTHIRARYLFETLLDGTKNLAEPLSQIINDPVYTKSAWQYLGVELFAQHEFDEFRNLNSRVLVGAGPIYHLIDSEYIDAMIGIAYVFEYVDVNTPNVEEFNHRLSSYLQLQITVNEVLSIHNVTFFQFKFDDPEDYLCLNDTIIKVHAFEWLALATRIKFSIDSNPPPHVEGLDMSVTTGISIEY